jgi:hypothetical protein
MNATKNNDSTVIDNDEVGGGSVNEKKRQYGPLSSSASSSSTTSTQRDIDSHKGSSTESSYNPLKHRSHLLHAIEGLNRYPNYLSRWKQNDVEALEQELKRVISQVREQKSNTEEQRHTIRLALGDFFLEHPEWQQFSVAPESWEEMREILDPRAYDAILRSLKTGKLPKDISVKDLIAGKAQVELDTGHLEEWMDEEMFDVYSFPLLSETFCRKLCSYASSILSYLESSPRQSDIPVRSCYRDIDNLGLEWLNDLIFHLILKPISTQLYRDTELEGGDLDWRQGFIAAYSGTPTKAKPRQRLVPHTDDAEVSQHWCID